ncbi:MAG: hypothetical protein GXZ08_08025 [Tissierellia bacterium]|nr:hypothetical protein [Tissierellia bacterium]
MKKRRILYLALVMMLGISVSVFAAGKLETINSEQKVVLNDETVNVAGYMIEESNYYKIRDIAAVLNNTKAKFNVSYNPEKKTVEIVTGENYMIENADLNSSKVEAKSVMKGNQKVFINGKEANLQSYLINGNNYFKLRDLGKALAFEVDFDNTTKTVLMKSDFISKTVKHNDYVEISGYNIAINKAYNIFTTAHPNAKVTEISFEKDDGVYVYEIEGIEGKTKYEMKIDKNTGEIIKDRKDGIAKQGDTKKTFDLSEVKSVEYLLNQGLKNAGKDDKVKEWKLSIDDGKLVFDIELFSGLEIEVNGLSGEIMDIDD